MNIPQARIKIDNQKKEILKDLENQDKPKKINILDMGMETYRK